MIISGFTQRKHINNLTDEPTMPGQHSHCIRCHQVNCSKFPDNVTACVMVVCELCGWRCHECKESEHTLRCPEERVACLNKEYGCPHVLKRSKMAAHLSVCPASVVFCAEEWSRWPMHAREQGMRIPLPQEKSYLDCGQLDVGLAMRDQRMLIDSLHAPRKLRQTLRNSLTIKYPAAPFPNCRASSESDPGLSEDTSQTVSDDESDAPWDLSKPHPGLKESIRSRLFRVTKETADSLVAALEMTSHVLSSTQTRLSGISEAGDGSNFELTEDLKVPDTGIMQKSTSSVESNESSVKPVSNPAQEYIYQLSVNKSVEVSADGVNVDESISQSFVPELTNPFVDYCTRRSVSSDRFSDTSVRSKSTLHDIGGTQLHKLMGYQPEEGQGDEILLHKMLGVSINFECINKYVTKPQSMYTFICAQNFRRDEYCWHFKNVHLEVHTGFFGWLEKRCPLSYLGCTFSYQNLEPIQPNSVLYHSWLQESFGLRSTIQPFTTSCDFNVSSNAKNVLNGEVSSAQFNPEIEPNHLVQRNIAQNKGQNCDNTSASAIEDISAKISTCLNNSINVTKELNQLTPEPEAQISAKVWGDYNLNSVDKVTSFDNQHCDKPQDDSPASNGSRESTLQICHSLSHERDIKASNFLRVQPIVYTASNWDSKVLFQYDLEEEDEEPARVTDFYHSLTNLPFELLRHIARKLDSFSLCNLALTCHLLRDVCCSLLDERGIVLLNWQKQKSEVNGRVSWKVVNKRWMFSTGFEPIHTWRFSDDHPTIGDHLKVCPFNRDIIRHTKPFQLLPPVTDQFSFSRESS